MGLMNQNLFAKLNGVSFAPKLRGTAGLSGNRRSSAKGSSVEFSDYREYLPGDDTRRIDWNAYGRFNKLYIKQYMEEQELPVNLLLDNSGSMAYGEKEKCEMGVGILEAMAYLALKNQDVVYLALSQGNQGSIAYRGGQSIQRIFAYLEENQAKRGNADSFLESIMRLNFHGPGITFLVSDCLFPEEMDSILDYLAFRMQTVVLFHVLSREELEGFPEDMASTIELRDMEEGNQLRLSLTRKHMKEYRKRVIKYKHEIEEALVQRGMFYIPVCSDDSLDKIVFEQMRKTGLLNR